jgi:hypothetical protein
MKELEPRKRDKLEVAVVKPIEKQYKKVGTLKPEKGHTCFELNLSNGNVTIAEYETTSVSIIAAAKGDTSPHHKLKVKENCIYTTALNRKNAFKKFKRMLFDKSAK